MKTPSSGFSDLHCHILPGLDDGARDYSDSLLMARQFERAGFKRVIATPHFIPGTAWSASKKAVQKAVDSLNARLREEGIDLNVYPGMEIGLHPNVSLNIRKGIFMPLANSNFILLEPSFSDKFRDILTAVEECRSEEIDIILAHPERIPVFQKNTGHLLELLQTGISLQVNIPSLLGRFGTVCRKTAEYLLEHEVPIFLGSDAHNSTIRRPPAAEELYSLEREFGIDLTALLVEQTSGMFNKQ